MILKYLDPEIGYSAQERVLNTIYIGAVRRDQLLRLLSNCLKHARVDQVLQELRRKGWLSTVYTSEKGQAIYFLTRRGLRQIGENGSKTARHRLIYHVSVFDVLLRCIGRFGVSGWEWHENPNESIGTGRKTPSALVRIDGRQWWLDVDDSLRMSHQLRDTCNRYTRFFRESVQPERVLFVAINQQRAKYLRNRVAGISGESVNFFVCTSDRVADVLAGTAVMTS